MHPGRQTVSDLVQVSCSNANVPFKLHVPVWISSAGQIFLQPRRKLFRIHAAVHWTQQEAPAEVNRLIVDLPVSVDGKGAAK
jgi:pimeloyl-ACP methyl ester carboxylesterase